MRYLVIIAGKSAFYTRFFEPENHYVDGMIVIDLHEGMIYTGGDWELIQVDKL